jgi:hypothetical protein
LRKHRTGIALTVLGGAFTVPGIALMGIGFSNPGSIHTQSYSSPGYTGATASGPGVTGVILSLIGVPMLIAGIVRLVQANKML